MKFCWIIGWAGILWISSVKAVEPAPSTRITSDRLEMVRYPEKSEFKFYGNVHIHAKDFYGNCDEMTVYSHPASHQGQLGQIRDIVAVGNVYLCTEDKTGPEPEKRESTSGQAHIYPEEDKMVLTENPVITCSKQGRFAGDKIILHRKTNQVVVESTQGSGRSQVELPENFGSQTPTVSPEEPPSS
jgi:lipopolysaccharide export system protein LptA